MVGGEGGRPACVRKGSVVGKGRETRCCGGERCNGGRKGEGVVWRETCGVVEEEDKVLWGIREGTLYKEEKVEEREGKESENIGKERIWSGERLTFAAFGKSFKKMYI